MIRNLLLILTGVVVTIAAFCALGRWQKGRSWLLTTILQKPVGILPGGSGSNIRVVGGSIKTVLAGGYNFSTDSKNQLQVQNADALTFAVENVSESKTGSVGTFSYSQAPGKKWTIEILTRDPKDDARGVQIKGSAGYTASDGAVGFFTINNDDSFVPGASSTERLYKNYAAGSHCGGDTRPCERIGVIRVGMNGGTPDIWYCVDPDAHCNVEIGASQP